MRAWSSVCVWWAWCVVRAACSTHFSFRDDGAFRILQVADLHYGNGWTDPCMDVDYDAVAHCDGSRTLAFLKRTIEQERPDFVVFTGDQIDGAADDPAVALDAVLDPVIEAGIPWSAVLGNHDGENSLSRQQVMEYLSSKPLSRIPVGQGDYMLTVGSNGSNGSFATPMWFLDSGNRFNDESYDWIKPAQLTWVASTHAQMRGDFDAVGINVNPGLAFWHIPIPEFKSVLSIQNGTRNEGVSSSRVNSGLYGTLLLHGVKAGFVGHDHTNDYCGTHFGNVVLCYGGGAGYHTYGMKGWARRMRVIELRDQGRKAVTWVHLDAKTDSPVEGFTPLFSDVPNFAFDPNVQLAVSLARRKSAVFVFVVAVAFAYLL